MPEMLDESGGAQSDECVASDKIGVELDFSTFPEPRMSVEGLRLVERILDQVYASPTCQFTVRVLNLSNWGIIRPR